MTSKKELGNFYREVFRIKKVLLDPKTDDALWLCETVLADIASKSPQDEREFVNENIETLGNLRFLIKQLKEGLLK